MVNYHIDIGQAGISSYCFKFILGNVKNGSHTKIKRNISGYFLDLCMVLKDHIDGLVQDCSNSSALAIDLL